MSLRRIDFAIIGSPKTGSTSLVDYLRQHPRIFLPTQKEVPFFVYDDAWAGGERYLQPFFADAGARTRVGIAHVHMLSFATASERARSYNPDLQLLLVVRDPVARAYSAYWHMRKLLLEPAATFEDALALEESRVRDGKTDRSDLGYVRDGEYAARLEPWLERFPRERLHVVLTDDLDRSADAAVGGVLTWLGLGADTSGLDLEERSNVAAEARWMPLHRFLVSQQSVVKGLYKRVVPAGVRYRIRVGLKDKLLAWNLKKAEYPPMQAETSRRLREHFAPHNRRLGQLIGRDLSHW